MLCTAATASGEGRLTGTRGRCISPTTPPTASPRSPKKSLPVAAVSKVAVRPLLFQCDTTSSEDVRMAENHGGIRGEQERGKNEVPALFGGYCCKVHDSYETDDDGVICHVTQRSDDEEKEEAGAKGSQLLGNSYSHRNGKRCISSSRLSSSSSSDDDDGAWA